MALITIPYNPLFVRMVVNGVPVLNPASTPDALTATYDEDRVVVKKGMYGDAAFEINVATNGAFNVVLRASSPTNALLSALMRAHAQFRTKLVNKNTAVEAASSSACMVQSVPTVGGGSEASDRTWVIAAAIMDIRLDGHLPATIL